MWQDGVRRMAYAYGRMALRMADIYGRMALRAGRRLARAVWVARWLTPAQTALHEAGEQSGGALFIISQQVTTPAMK